MNKQIILSEILKILEEEYLIINNASKTAYEAATHEESKAEDQYDTRGLEASYLAQAQSVRAGEIQKSIKVLKELTLTTFTNSDSVRPGALIELLQDKHPFWIFFLPAGAGVNVSQSGTKIAVVTTTSPFGNEIRGKKSGDSFEFSAKGNPREYEIINLF